MSDLNFIFMAIEEIKITNIQFGGGGAYIAVTVNNTGISAVTINEAWVNSVVVTTTSPTLPKPISAYTGIVLNMTSTWTEGNNYQVKLLSSKGNQFLYNVVATSQVGVILYKANVYFYGDGTKINIDVGNCGDSNTEIIEVYVGIWPGNIIEQEPTQTLPISLAVDSIATLTLNYNWTQGTIYHFKITSSTGQTLEFPELAPT